MPLKSPRSAALPRPRSLRWSLTSAGSGCRMRRMTKRWLRRAISTTCCGRNMKATRKSRNWKSRMRRPRMRIRSNRSATRRRRNAGGSSRNSVRQRQRNRRKSTASSLIAGRSCWRTAYRPTSVNWSRLTPATRSALPRSRATRRRLTCCWRSSVRSGLLRFKNNKMQRIRRSWTRRRRSWTTKCKCRMNTTRLLRHSGRRI